MTYEISSTLLTTVATSSSFSSIENTVETTENNCTFYEWSRNPVHAKFFRIFSIISVLTVLVVVVVLGNALVIAAVLLRRRLRSATGLLILSLGVADLLVGTVILPFSIANEVLDQYWIFGERWCTIWLTMDIWMCTASIYNLVAISIDRYIAIIKPLNYPMLVTKFRARCTVVLVWIGSFIICSPSFFLASSIKNKDTPCRCTPANAGRAYVIFSASSSFYIPMVIVIFVYFRIYIAARAATKSIYSGMMSVTANANKSTKSYLLSHPNVLSKDSLPMLRVHRGSSIANFKSNMKNSNGHNTNGVPLEPIGNPCARGVRESTSSGDGASPPDRKSSDDHPTAGHAPIHSVPTSRRATHVAVMHSLQEHTTTDSESSDAGTPINDLSPPQDQDGQISPPPMQESLPAAHQHKSMNPIKRILRRGQKKRAGGAYEKRLSLEIKAAKTVAIVTGCFIFCWLGFSLVYGLEIQLNDVVWSIVFWLGYLNSALNPVIYTVFNREFRICFKRLLTCHHLNHPVSNKTIHQQNNNSYNSTIRTQIKTGGGNSGRMATASSPPIYSNPPPN